VKIKKTYRKNVRKKRVRRRTIEYEGKERKKENLITKRKSYNKLEQRKEMKVRRKEISL